MDRTVARRPTDGDEPTNGDGDGKDGDRSDAASRERDRAAHLKAVIDREWNALVD
ncbi:MAG: hypothetical protein ABEI80_05955 [Haloplanus sp.]